MKRNSSNAATEMIPVLEKDSREYVTVTHIDNPECFYVQLRRCNEEFTTFSNRIEETVEQLIPLAKKPEQSKLYIVKYETPTDSPQWCRGRVIDIMQDNKGEPAYKVQFIDYGNSQTVAKQNFREISSTLAEVPPFALQCKLFNFYPRHEVWHFKTVLLMARILTGEFTSDELSPKILKYVTNVLMVVVEKYHNILEVDLLLETSSTLTSIRYALIFLTHGVPCPNTSAPIRSSKIVAKLHKRSEGFKKGLKYNIVISHVVNPHNLYVQMACTVPHIEYLAQIMNRYYTNRPTKGQILDYRTGLLKGMAVAVQYTEDYNVQWYRGTITDIIKGHNLIKVFLVDYGRNVTVSYTEICKLPERFCYLDCQAIPVKMTGIKPYKQEMWNQRIIDYLNQYVIDKTKLILIVAELKNTVEVALYEDSVSLNVCINTVLVKERLAISTSEQVVEVGTSTPKIKNSHNPEENKSSHNLEESKSDQKIAHVPIKVLKFKSPNQIYVRILTEEIIKEQYELHTALQNLYRNRPLEDREWEINEFCVVYDIKKKHYFRAIIRDKIDYLNYKVFLLDVAHEIETTKSNIHTLQNNVKHFSIGAVQCHLAGIAPSDCTNKWSCQTIQYLENIFENSKSIQQSMPIMIWYTEFKSEEAVVLTRTILHNINQLLVKKGLALEDRTFTDSIGSIFDSLQTISKHILTTTSRIGINKIALTQKNISEDTKKQNIAPTTSEPKNEVKTQYNGGTSIKDKETIQFKVRRSNSDKPRRTYDSTNTEAAFDATTSSLFYDYDFIHSVLSYSLIGQTIRIMLKYIINYNNFIFEILNDTFEDVQSTTKGKPCTTPSSQNGQYKGEIYGITLPAPSYAGIVEEYMAAFFNNTLKLAEIISINPLQVQLYNNDGSNACRDLIDQHLLIYSNFQVF